MAEYAVRKRNPQHNLNTLKESQESKENIEKINQQWELVNAEK